MTGAATSGSEALAQCRALCEPIPHLCLSYAACFQAAVDSCAGNGGVPAAADKSRTGGDASAPLRGAVVATYLAEALYEQNELEACRALLADYLPIIVDTGMPDHLIIAHRICARIHFQFNERDQAFARLAALDELGATRGIARLRAAEWLEKGHLFLLDGDTENAGRVG